MAVVSGGTREADTGHTPGHDQVGVDIIIDNVAAHHAPAHDIWHRSHVSVCCSGVSGCCCCWSAETVTIEPETLGRSTLITRTRSKSFELTHLSRDVAG